VLVEAEGHVPYAPRLVAAPPGWTRVVLVQTVAGPLAGDHTTVDVAVGPGAALELVTNAATLAYPAALPARQEVRVRVGAGARFVWAPALLILAAGCDFDSLLELDLEAGAAVCTRELVVLGRHGEASGRYRSRFRCELEGRPLLHEGVEIDPEGIAESSSALLAGARAFASVAVLGVDAERPPGPGELELAGPGRVLRALARDAAALSAEIAPVEAAYRALVGAA
jgi:urease accessory protein